MWQDAIDKEMECLCNCKVFADSRKDAAIPDGYKPIKVHLMFDIKHDGRHRVQMVVDGHLTDFPIDSVYSGVASLHGFRLKTYSSKQVTRCEALY